MKNRFVSILNMNKKKNGMIPFCTVILLIVTSSLLVACTNISSSQSSNWETHMSEISEILKEHLGISPYIPETDYELGAVILVYPYTDPGEDKEPHYATVSYFESLKEMEPIVDKESIELWQENTNGNELAYGNLYAEPRSIFIEIFPDGIELGDSQIIEVAGHEIQYLFLKGDRDDIMMAINFEDVGYLITYSVQSDNLEEAAKELAEDIINNNL